MEPKPIKNIIPRCPSRFNDEEKKEWKFYKRILENYGLFNLAAQPTLELLCVSMAQYKACATTVGESGIIIKGGDGLPTKNPYWEAMITIEKQIEKYHKALALSNAGLAMIASVAIAAQKQKSELEELMD